MPSGESLDVLQGSADRLHDRWQRSYGTELQVSMSMFMFALPWAKLRMGAPLVVLANATLYPLVVAAPKLQLRWHRSVVLIVLQFPCSLQLSPRHDPCNHYHPIM